MVYPIFYTKMTVPTTLVPVFFPMTGISTGHFFAHKRF